MRILLVEPGPNFSVMDVHRGWTRALRNLGCEVVSFNLSDRLDFYTQAALKRKGRWRKAVSGMDAIRMAAAGIEAAAFQFWPDVVVITSCFFVPPEVMERLRIRGMKVVLLFTEGPYENDGQLQRAPYADLCILNDPTGLDQFADITTAMYVPHAYDPEIHWPRPAKPEYASDFCFVGTGFPSRQRFFDAVDWTGVDVALAGNWLNLPEESRLRKFVAHDIRECVDNTDAVDLYRASKASVNLYRDAAESERPELADGWAMSPREVELAACGRFFLRQPRGEGDEVLPMLPTFDGPGDFEEKLRWWLARDCARADVEHEAQAAIADRTFKANAIAFLHAVDNLTTSNT